MLKFYFFLCVDEDYLGLSSPSDVAEEYDSQVESETDTDDRDSDETPEQRAERKEKQREERLEKAERKAAKRRARVRCIRMTFVGNGLHFLSIEQWTKSPT